MHTSSATNLFLEFQRGCPGDYQVAGVGGGAEEHDAGRGRAVYPAPEAHQEDAR